jgi:hypothetical protein
MVGPLSVPTQCKLGAEYDVDSISMFTSTDASTTAHQNAAVEPQSYFCS